MTDNIQPHRRVEEFGGGGNRMLVLEAQTEDALNRMVEKAKARGWEIYATGTVPNTNAFGVWLTKLEGGNRSVGIK